MGKGIPIASTWRIGLWERISSDSSVSLLSSYLSIFLFLSLLMSVSLVLSPSLSPVLSHPRHEIATIFVPFVPYGSPIAGSVRRAPIARERASRPGRVESQPDRLKCNWRAHYLVLSHRDNYPRGRFHQSPLSPLFRLKHDDVTRRAGFTKYSDFFFSSASASAPPPRKAS